LVGVVLDCAFFNTLQVLVSNVLIVFDKLRKNFDSVCFKEVEEFSNVHWALSLKVNLSDDLSVLDAEDFLLNVLGMLKHDELSLLEGVNGSLAFLDVLVDGQGEPVVVLVTLVHVSVQLVDLGVHQFLLDWLQIAESGFVASEQLLKSVDVPHVVFLLEGDVDDGLWNTFADSVEELSFSDDDFQVRCEVDFVINTVTNFDPLQDVFFEKSDGFISVLTFPFSENLLFVVLVELFGKLNVFTSNFSESL
jgi:hypothetical protein